MHKASPALLRALPLAAVLLLGACHPQPTTIVAGPPDDMKNALANAKPVELPPAVQSTKSYRCADSSVIYIDWFTGGKLANLHVKKDGPPTSLVAKADGNPLVGGGYTVSGNTKAASIEYTQPGKDKQSCKA